MQRPHAVIALPNNIEIDARAQRNALALVAAGYRVTMVGFGTGIPNEGVIAGIPYILCQARSKSGGPAPAAGPKPPSILYRIVRKAFHLVLHRRPPQKVAKAIARVEETAGAVVKQANKRVLRPAQGLVNKTAQKVTAPKPDPDAPFDWRSALPHVPVMTDALRDVIAGLEPDLIVTDVHLLPMGAEVADIQRAKGRQMGLLYDAREYVYGLASDDQNVTLGFPALETEAMPKVDATVTVCQPIADFLAKQYSLSEVPPLVPNAPIGNLPETGRTLTIRDFLKIDDEAPLLVYAGGLSYHRGVHDAVVALKDLPGVHLAIGARRESSYTDELEAIATTHGVRDRVHFVPFAPTHEVAEYLASATAAVMPFLPVGNHNWAAPNKYFESVQARLPILTSNMDWLSERVTTLGIGEVFLHSNPPSLAEAAKKLLGNLDQYRAKLTDELVAEHTFEHFEHVIVDVAKQITDPKLLPGLEPTKLHDNLAAIRSDMLRQRATLADSKLFEPRPWIRIGCANTGGLPQLWAKALMREYPQAIAESVWRHREQSLTFPVDETVTYGQWVSPAWQKQLQAKLEDRVSHVLTESGRSVIGAKFGAHFYDEVGWFARKGIRQGLVFHGSDIRNPRIHASLEPDSPFKDPTEELTAILQRQVEDLTPHVLSFDGPVFVTTNDLLDYLPQATWLPVVVDTDEWRTSMSPLAHGGLPIVFHVPSRRSIKGSEDVDAVCRELETEGLIVYRGLNELSRDEMREQMLTADIVIDQIRLGDYGITAVEAMSGSRVVIGHVADRVRQRIKDDVPIVEATSQTLRSVLLDVAADPARAAVLGSRGREYAKRWHDGRHSAHVLAEFMGLGEPAR
ncbi:glycosyltransferase [Tessaracoccus sp. MC1865]|uniref:glycosyltransferase n=1 Tax=Tessaracoccus sp. MC1865 TaxID=2760310 RepID=UPI0016040136|nr:glycosyltransferase [Tessaracoccus sp. MC1865]MBB1482821.1 glycosyltransferase [Tessaracoccus sp. MC1865]QTO37739.1 glycosyltransferase [Tessaracoccus sp. MC1865]